MNKIVYVVCIMCIFCSFAYSSSASLSKIIGIEKQLFGYEYKNDSEINRINRIEKYLYGKTSANPVEKRLKKISLDIGYVDNDNATPVASGTQEKIASSPQQTKIYEKEDSTVQYPIVDKIENSVFNRIYTTENIYQRVDRLEKKVFGKNSNDNLSNRVNKLRLAVVDDGRNNDFITGAALPTENYYDSINSSYDDNTAYSTDSRLPDDNFNYTSPSTSRNATLASELSTIEQKMFKQSFANDNVDQRLARLETQIFKRNFTKDAPSTRLQRIAAVNTAQKTSKMYDNNKLTRNLNTGMQVGTFILMILAMIL